MKRFLLSSAFLACLVTGLVSLWVAAYPISALAASATATCANGSTVTCSSAGSCLAQDAGPSVSGYCLCMENGVPTAYDYCRSTAGGEINPVEGPVN
jgi:hypothetical protein